MGLLLVIVGGLAALHHVGAAVLLSPAQQNAQVLGDRTHAITAGVGVCDPGTTCPLAPSLVRAVRDGGGHRADVMLSTSPTRVEGHAGLAPMILETDWAAEPHPQRYELSRGRWPQADGEVAVSPAVAAALDQPDSIGLYGGAVALKVVGVAQDRFVRDAQVLYAPTGTIGSVYGALSDQGHRYSKPEVMGTARFDGGDLAQIATSLTDDVAKMTGTDREVLHHDITSSIIERKPEHRSSFDYFARSAVVIGWVPFVVAPLVASAVLAASTVSGDRRVRRTLWRLGVPETVVAAIQASALLLAVALVSALAVVFGDLAGRALRPWLDAGSTHPLSPPMPPWAVLTVCGAAACAPVLLRGVAGILAPSFRVGRRKRSMGQVARRILTVCLRIAQFTVVAAGTAWVVGILAGSSASSVSDVSRWVVALCLVLSVAIGMVLARGEDRRGILPLPLMLALRRLRRAPAVTSATATAVMLCVSLPLSAGVALTTSQYYSNLQFVAPVAPGQVALGYNQVYSTGVPVQVREDFQDFTGLQGPVAVRTAWVDTGQFMQGLPLVVGSIEDVERLVGHPLSAQQAETFAQGGLLVPSSDEPNHPQTGDRVATKTHTGRDTGILPVTEIGPVPEAYSAGNIGFISLERARTAGWKLDGTYWVYDNVGDPQLAAALQAAQAQDFDASYVLVHHIPESIPPPASWYWATAGLSAVLLILVLWVARHHTRALGAYRHTLRSLGVGPKILFLTVCAVVITLVLIPATAGLAAALIANEIAWNRLLDDTTGAVYPWNMIWIADAAVLTATITGLLSSVRLPHAESLDSRAEP